MNLDGIKITVQTKKDTYRLETNNGEIKLTNTKNYPVLFLSMSLLAVVSCALIATYRIPVNQNEKVVATQPETPSLLPQEKMYERGDIIDQATNCLLGQNNEITNNIIQADKTISDLKNQINGINQEAILNLIIFILGAPPAIASLILRTEGKGGSESESFYEAKKKLALLGIIILTIVLIGDIHWFLHNSKISGLKTDQIEKTSSKLEKLKAQAEKINQQLTKVGNTNNYETPEEQFTFVRQIADQCENEQKQENYQEAGNPALQTQGAGGGL